MANGAWRVSSGAEWREGGGVAVAGCSRDGETVAHVLRRRMAGERASWLPRKAMWV